MLPQTKLAPTPCFDEGTQKPRRFFRNFLQEVEALKLLPVKNQQGSAQGLT